MKTETQKTEARSWIICGVFAGYRIDRAVVLADTVKEAKAKFRNLYDNPSLVRSVRSEGRA